MDFIVGLSSLDLVSEWTKEDHSKPSELGWTKHDLMSYMQHLNPDNTGAHLYCWCAKYLHFYFADMDE